MSKSGMAAPDDTTITCSNSVQPLIDAAAPGATVTFPACIARETLTIAKPLTLQGQSGSEIRGSDVWTDWQQRGGTWVSADAVPQFNNDSDHDGRCGESTNRCVRSEQVFVDGQALYPVGQGSQPSFGQFSLDGARHVILADNPDGRMVEVTTRRQWIITQSDGVTIENLSMLHSASDALHGGISNDGFSNWTLQDSALSDAHGADISLHNGSNLQVLDDDISGGGDMGIHGTVLNDSVVQGNRIHDNALDEFNPAWGAGGLKFTEARNVVIDRNEVDHNRAEGLWCDTKCYNITYSGNKVHDNLWPGIEFEVSDGASIHDNIVWQNGWDEATWAWGAGILISSSAHAEVFNNTVAWNYAGISVIAQNRPDLVPPVGNFVHDNEIIRDTTTGDFSQTYWQNLALAWLADGVPSMFDPGANNRGLNNRYWYDQPEGDAVRTSWDGKQFQHLDEFASTPGDENAAYISDDQKDARLAVAGIPFSPTVGSL